MTTAQWNPSFRPLNKRKFTVLRIGHLQIVKLILQSTWSSIIPNDRTEQIIINLPMKKKNFSLKKQNPTLSKCGVQK